MKKLSKCVSTCSFLSCLVLSACGASDSGSGGSESEAGGPVEIFSWWTSGGEEEALEALIKLHEERIPSAKVTNAAVAFADKARDQLQDRMERALPPDTFQANLGADLFKWVGNASKIESLERLASEEGWNSGIDASILDAASQNGVLYGLPLNVHRINSLFYRKDLFEKHHLEVPTSIEGLNALCDRIVNDGAIQADAPGGRMACLALGNKWDWTLSLVTFEMVLPAVSSGAYYESFWQGAESAGDAEITAALDEALYLYCGGTDTTDCLSTTYFNRDIGEVTWSEGVQKLVDGDAMMAPMGDWAKGFLEAQGMTPGEEFDVAAFPGSAGTFVFTSDTFPLPKGASNPAGAVELLRTFGSKEGQIAFNRLKGSIPVRTDLDEEEFDIVTQSTIAEFRSSAKVRALSGLLEPDVMGDLPAELAASLREGSTEIVSNHLRANYETLK